MILPGVFASISEQSFSTWQTKTTVTRDPPGEYLSRSVLTSEDPVCINSVQWMMRSLPSLVQVSEFPTPSQFYPSVGSIFSHLQHFPDVPKHSREAIAQVSNCFAAPAAVQAFSADEWHISECILRG